MNCSAFCISYLPRVWLRLALSAIVLLPGILGTVSLHPYEYIYYNSFVGGVRGANGVYELDRWCLSLREGMRSIDNIASPGASIIVASQTDPNQLSQVEDFARADLQLTNKLRCGQRLTMSFPALIGP